MREIKFRAWCKRRFLKDTEFAVLPSGLLMFYDERDPDLGWYLNQTYDIQLSQYTGIHDKNGQEIYEGDIVEYKPFACCNSQGSQYDCIRGDVQFDSGHFSAGTVRGKYGMHMLYDLEKYEVIGNIYENPELIKQIPHSS